MFLMFRNFAVVAVVFFIMCPVVYGQSSLENEGCFWLISQNTPTYHLDGDKAVEDEISCWPEGGFLYRPKISGGRAWFTLGDDGEEKFVYMRDLTKDPRMTDWWEKIVMGFIDNPRETLWSSIAFAAHTEEYPCITKSIIRDMQKSRILKKDEERKLTGEKIRDKMLEYSSLVWD